jgi:hypothetical protein
MASRSSPVLSARLDPFAPVRYLLDTDDQLIAVNDRWNVFAVENGAPELQESAVIGRHLWSFISDATTRAIYADLLRHVRRGHAASVPFRCDGPHVRREMHLVMRPLDARAVECTAFYDVEIPQQQVPFWTPAPGRYIGVLRACSWCKRVQVGGLWMEAEDAVPLLPLRADGSVPEISHAICPTCSTTLQLSAKETP